MPMSKYVQDLRAKVGTTHLLMPSVTALIFDADQRFLLVRHSHRNEWVAPGGAIDPDESPQDAVVREVWEETGLHVVPTHVRGIFSGPEFRIRYTNGDEVTYAMAMFECQLIGGTLRPDNDEVHEARWFCADDLQNLALSKWARILLPRLIQNRESWIPPITWHPPE
jgi:8-oxo-dGTP pyrophosphatase MutT (NUDIX family)